MMKTLFLHPPSYAGFDGGAGSRYQARREIRSFWFPTWLAQPAALVPGSRLVDAPPARLPLAEVLPLAKQHELIVLHTSTPSAIATAPAPSCTTQSAPFSRTWTSCPSSPRSTSATSGSRIILSAT